MSGIFISHTHSDKPIADGLASLAGALFGDRLPVNYSSKKELEGGIAPGEDWFRWIVDQVRQSDVALILLTPASIQKPWVVWEAGAVAGAAFATSTEQARVFPITYGIKSTDVPTPFANTQLLNGTDAADMQKLVDELLTPTRFGKDFGPKDWQRVGANKEKFVNDYLGLVGPILLKLPLVITEASVQEWLGRLDDLRKEQRFSETEVMENWLDAAFGRDTQDKQRPLDLRIHRQLGELYGLAGRGSDAARQFELARQLAPRDIFLLRRLGQAYLDQKDNAKTGNVLAEIEALDKTAFERNAENAALKARWRQQTGDLNGARDTLALAFQNVPSSYYLGDRLGQVLIQLGEVDKAKDVYKQVGRVLRELREQNVWTYATAITAALVCDDRDGARQSLDKLRELRPSRGQLDSIERGVSNLLDKLKGDPTILAELRGMEQLPGLTK
jgi:tetratricopeptide (TPR) repeat protein